MENSKHFLKKHRVKIVQKTRNPNHLADFLLENQIISNEIYQNIKNKTTPQKQMRETYSNLNCEKHYDCMCEWLKKEEADLLKELEQGRDEADAPPNKKTRFENQDETVHNLSDLRKISTFAKLEHWISQPDTNQKLVSELEKKLEEKDMEDLRTELKDKESRKSLCFNASSIDEIRKNKEVDNFIGATNKAKFPKLAISMFFKKDTSASSTNESSAGCEESMDLTDLDSSGYGSFLSPSFPDRTSLDRVDVLFHNDRRSEDQDQSITTEDTSRDEGFGSADMEDVHSHEIPQRSDVPKQEDARKEIPLADGTGSTDVEEPHTDKRYEEPQRSDVTKHHNESNTKNELPLEDGFGSTGVEKMQIDKVDEEPQLQTSHFLMQQNEFIPKEESPQAERGGTMKQQDSHTAERDDELQISEVPKVPNSEDVSLHHHDQKEITLADGTGSADMKKPHTDKEFEETQISDVKKHQNESVIKSEIPEEDRFGSTNMQVVNYTNEIDEEPQRSDVPMREDVTLHQNKSLTTKEPPQEPELEEEITLADGTGSRNMKELFTHNIYQKPQRSDDPMTQNETPLADMCGKMKMQDLHTHEIKDQPQKLNDQKDDGEFLHKHYKITAEEGPVEDGFGSTDVEKLQIDKMADEPQPQTSHVLMQQNEFIPKKETPPAERCETMKMQDSHTAERDEEPQRSKVPHVPIKELADGTGSADMKKTYSDKKYEEPQTSDVPIHQNETITQKESASADRCGSMKMQDPHTHEMKEQMERSNVPNLARHEDRSLHQNETNTRKETPQGDRLGRADKQVSSYVVDDEPQRSKVPLQTISMNCMFPASNYGNEQENPDQMQMNSPSPTSEVRGALTMQAPKTRKKRNYSKNLKVKKKKDKDTWLRDWALRQCDGREEDLKNILDQISIIDVAEHQEYPCFTAENVMVYKYFTPESQIVFVTKDNTSISTKTMVQYHMFVCNIKKAIVLGPKAPKEQEVEYDGSKVPLEKCKNLIFKAFAPALAVYKHVQKEKHLFSLI